MHYFSTGCCYSCRRRGAVVVLSWIVVLTVIGSGVSTTTTIIPNPTEPSTEETTTAVPLPPTTTESVEKKSESRGRKLSQLRMAAELNGSSAAPYPSPVKSPLNLLSPDNTSMETCFAAFDIDR